MITLSIPERDFDVVEGFDNRTQEFVTLRKAKHIDAYKLVLEYSLKSIAKWETRWHRPFLSDREFEAEEWIDFIRCMTVNTVKDPECYNYLTNQEMAIIQSYTQDQQSAWVMKANKNDKKPKKSKSVTVEAVYYKMIQYGVWESCENWNFNRLMALLDYFDVQGGSTPGAGGQKKKSERELMSIYHDMNQKARAKYHSNG